MPSISEITALLKDALGIAPASATQSAQNRSQTDNGYDSQHTPSSQQIAEIGARLDAALALTPSSVPPTESAILSPKSVASQGLSQVDSGFGSPPAFIADDEEEDDDDDGGGGFSDVEPLDDSLAADDHGAALSVSKPDGKSCSGF